MKESQKLKKEAEQEENDLTALGIYGKVLRAERNERFEDKWLRELELKTEVTDRGNGSYSFDSKYGIIDFFPKANKLLIRKKNKWVKPALRFIIKNIIQSEN